MRNVLFTVAVVLFSTLAFAQVHCGQHIIEKQLRTASPELDAKMSKADEQAQVEYVTHGQRAEKIIIPVVFHVIHKNGPENISDAQIHSAIRIMNKDFNALNEEVDDVISAFQGIIGNGEIEFRLANIDPNGNPTNGIDRIESNETFTGNDNAKLNPWPRNKYYNIWTTDVITVVGASAAAYAYRPDAADGMPSVDGVISNHRYVGDIGTAIVSGSKTLTHETGHYLNLSHPWGTTNFPGCDGTATNPNDPCFGINNCNDDDGVFDTPNTIGVDNGNCNLSQTTCGSLDNVQNFMDYASCESMFTAGQITRMRNALSSSVAQRNALWTISNLAATGVSKLHEARFYVARNTACRGESVQFFDESRYDPDSWAWEISGPTTLTSSEQNPVFTFDQPGVYNIKLTVTQDGHTEEIEEENAFVVTDVYGSAVPFEENFQSPKTGWAVHKNEANDQYYWQLSDVYGFDDQASYLMYNIGQDGKNLDDLTFAGIDFRPLTNVSISFKVAYARLSASNNDVLSLSVSNDCGFTWRSVWSAGAAQLNNGKPNSTSLFRPENESDWTTFQVNNIPLAWLGENAMVRFRFEPGGGNQLYLDDINIDGTFSLQPFLVYPIDQSPDRPADVTLDWRAVPGVDIYEFELSKSDDFSTLAAAGSLEAIDNSSENEDTKFKTDELEHGTTYFWRVRSVTNNQASPWSEVWSFTVAEDGLGLESKSLETSIAIYPNPAQGIVNVSFLQPGKNVKLEMYNITGQLVYSKLLPAVVANHSMSIEVADFPNGTYVLRTTTPNNSFIKRLVVNN